MNIVVCLKQVPDTSEVKLNPETNTLIRDGVQNIMNPFDRQALETALILKDANGAKVTVVSMGPPQAEEILKEAISMGAGNQLCACRCCKKPWRCRPCFVRQTGC